MINIHCAGPASLNRVAPLLTFTELRRTAKGNPGSPRRSSFLVLATTTPLVPRLSPARWAILLAAGLGTLLGEDRSKRRIPGESTETLMLPLHTLLETKPNKLQARVHGGAFPGSKNNHPAPEPGRQHCAPQGAAGAPRRSWSVCAGKGPGTLEVHSQTRVPNAPPAT